MRHLTSLVVLTGFCWSMSTLPGCFDADKYRDEIKRKRYTCKSDSDCIAGYVCDKDFSYCKRPSKTPDCSQVYFTASGMTLVVHFPSEVTGHVTIDKDSLPDPPQPGACGPDGLATSEVYRVPYQSEDFAVRVQVKNKTKLIKAMFADCPYLCVAEPGSGYDPRTCTDDVDCDGYGSGLSCKGEDPDDSCEAVYPGAPEICDGRDNDGDELTDSADPDFVTVSCPLQEGVCAGSVKPCIDGKTLACDYGPDYVAVERADHCDLLDNDCDRETDEECDCQPGETRNCGITVGECRNGTQTCVNGTWAGECEGAILPQEEICDCKDNDCDGTTDDHPASETGHVCGEKCPTCDTIQIVTRVNGQDGVTVCMDRYEASVGSAPGISASVPGARPWTNVSFAEALHACSMRRMQLCPIEVWTAACSGPGRTTYPYGMEFQDGVCAGNDSVDGPQETASLPGCVSTWPGRGGNDAVGLVFDMSGNVKEWVSPPQGHDYERWTAGGSYASGSNGLTCTALEEHPDGAGAPDIGFRCCSQLPF